MQVWAVIADSVAIMLQSKLAKLWHFHSWTYRFGWATFALRDKQTSSALSVAVWTRWQEQLPLGRLVCSQGLQTEQRHDCHAWSVQWQARPGWSGCQSPNVCHTDCVPANCVFVWVVHHGLVRTVALSYAVCFCIHPKPSFITPSLHLFITGI